MKTRVRGLIELAAGWWVAIAAVGRQIRLVLQFDPTGEIPPNGIKVIILSRDEAIELRDVLDDAIKDSDLEPTFPRCLP